jgi:hypothetical protein
MEDLLNQTVILKTKIDESGYGTPLYADGVPISVRWEDVIQQVKDKNGKEVTSFAMVFSLTLINPDDVLTHKGTDWPVVKVAEIVDGGGKIHHWEAYI